ncbi:efflux RND transporter periplasmic adaptor subunit [Aliikangiella coralliicola]|uniref:Biotin/lipoyl-binding protein n=1 Tax=Aliikangiella coralliicola TaxID=2592383 RepID=A0A545UGY2_9GAMM|nr:hypothetical protein [Aliikangiella coralliicola]TQV88726.1 hypothetical protein FLL46_04125 [Aliikangiella coralliicola]
MFNLIKKQFLEKKIALPVIIIVGILLTVAIIKLQPAMEHNPQARPSIPVNFVTVHQHSLRPAIVGFGTVEPDVSLQAKAEVTGRVTFIHPELKKGTIIPKDTLVLKIDDKDYLLALKQAEADLLSNQASLKEMELTVENTKLDLKLAVEKLKVRNKELTRLERLRKSGSISQSKLDAERQNKLQQQQEVQQLENQLTTLPSDIEVLKAKIDISKAKVEQSQRDLARTEIRLPFNGRISKVDAELDQYAATGSLLFEASGLDKVTINAQFPINQFRQIAQGFDREKINFSDPASIPRMSELFASLGMSAKVYIAGSQFEGWEAKVERISDNLDPQSRTLGVVVSVSDSYKNINPATKPPLLEGNYMQVNLFGAANQFLVAPRYALHENQVYRINSDNTLQRVDVSNVQLQGELALFKNTLTAGDKIITSDVFPAVNGMKVTPVEDSKAQQSLTELVEMAQ